MQTRSSRPSLRRPAAPARTPILALLLVLACGSEQGTGDTPSTGDVVSTGDAPATGGTSTTGEPATTTAADPTTTAADPTTTAADPTTTAASSSGGACEAEATDECSTCMQGACCEDLAACQDDPKCVACVTGEDGTQCESNEETHARVQRYLECRGGPCQESCIMADGASCEEALAVFQPDDCTECLAAECCDAVAACATNAICWDGCFTNHSPDKCHSDPDGHALYHALAVCMQDGCNAACSG